MPSVKFVGVHAVNAKPVGAAYHVENPQPYRLMFFVKKMNEGFPKAIPLGI